MAKPMTEVSRNTLELAIRKAETDGPLKNLDALWTAACEIYNSMDVPKQITKSVVMLRATAWKLETKTKPGKKGRAAGVPLSEEQKAAMQAGRGARKPRAEKFAGDPVLVQGFSELRKEVPERFLPLVEKLTNKGSMRAAVALKCLDCSGYSTVEVRLCPCTSCPLYAFRPYKGKAGDDEVVELDETVEETEAEAA
jgi:hypothetical protein